VVPASSASHLSSFEGFRLHSAFLLFAEISASASRTMALLVILLSLLVPAVISVVFLPKVLHLLAELLGHQIRRSSNTRRDLLLDRVATETKSFEAEHKEKSKEDDDWEKVVPSPIGSAVNVGKAGAEWRGIVGFFHPFW
jgi:alpha-1,2-mannosyltransferase